MQHCSHPILSPCWSVVSLEIFVMDWVLATADADVRADGFVVLHLLHCRVLLILALYYISYSSAASLLQESYARTIQLQMSLNVYSDRKLHSSREITAFFSSAFWRSPVHCKCSTSNGNLLPFKSTSILITLFRDSLQLVVNEGKDCSIQLDISRQEEHNEYFLLYVPWTKSGTGGQIHQSCNFFPNYSTFLSHSLVLSQMRLMIGNQPDHTQNGSPSIFQQCLREIPSTHSEEC